MMIHTKQTGTYAMIGAYQPFRHRVIIVISHTTIVSNIINYMKKDQNFGLLF